jgi:hypothetical protein
MDFMRVIVLGSSANTIYLLLGVSSSIVEGRTNGRPSMKTKITQLLGVVRGVWSSLSLPHGESVTAQAPLEACPVQSPEDNSIGEDWLGLTEDEMYGPFDMEDYH